MTYPETIQYLESFINYENIPDYPYKESLKLEQVKNFLAAINNPQGSLRCLHIAGTKGKGSTCVFVAYMLRQAGYKVGLYTSPHLLDFRERIRILTPNSKLQTPNLEFEGMISKDELVDLIKQLKPAIEKYNQSSEYGPLSFFEVYTSLAFVYFKEKKVDFAVLETGLGGRLDATNVVNPLAAAITPISYEHTQKLGNTLKEIATEKAGIIKNKELVVISAPQEEEAGQVIRTRCFEVGSRLYEVNKDIFCDIKKAGFGVRGIFGKYPNLKIRLPGKHQLINATVAVGVIEALRFHNINVGIDAIRDGLYNTIWPGRCDVVSSNPLIVLDGAQNIASMRALKETIKENFKYKRLILILGISSDKDVKGICNEIYDLADEIILTKADNPRATEPEILAKYFYGKEVYITDNTQEAKAQALCLAKKEDLILVCGSLFVVGEFRNG
ncbi:MAG: folylpolyglutamate synthase/dihydrofolate synthase family protein [Candidatus Omnitrophota bacterium]|nr:folylpolyglutamate synthase/dihydrofolate synthase family protein [Candidatus Omnitrophota bacterium]